MSAAAEGTFEPSIAPGADRAREPRETAGGVDVAKLAAEHYCVAFHGLYGLETVSLRYFNIFGPRQDPNSPYSGVVSRFIDAITSGDAPTIHGEGNLEREAIVWARGDVEQGWAEADVVAAGKDRWRRQAPIQILDVRPQLCVDPGKTDWTFVPALAFLLQHLAKRRYMRFAICLPVPGSPAADGFPVRGWPLSPDGVNDQGQARLGIRRKVVFTAGIANRPDGRPHSAELDAGDVPVIQRL